MEDEATGEDVIGFRAVFRAFIDGPGVGGGGISEANLTFLCGGDDTLLSSVASIGRRGGRDSTCEISVSGSALHSS